MRVSYEFNAFFFKNALLELFEASSGDNSENKVGFGLSFFIFDFIGTDDQGERGKQDQLADVAHYY